VKCPSFRPLLIPLLVGLLTGCTAPGPVALDLDGKSVPAISQSEVATVLIFVARDCPISNRYAPEIRRLALKYARRDVAFRLVYADEQDTPEAIRKHREEYGLSMPALRDVDHALVRLAGVQVTPEAAVFNRRIQRVYRGRIDDRFADFGKMRPEPTQRELIEAIEATLQGRPAVTSEQPAIGCPIAIKPGPATE